MQREKQQTQVTDLLFLSCISFEENLLTTQPLPRDCTRFLPATLSHLSWGRVSDWRRESERDQQDKNLNLVQSQNPKQPLKRSWRTALFTVRFHFSSSAPQGEAALAAGIRQCAQVGERYASAPLLGEPSHVASVTAATHRMLRRLALVAVVGEGSGGRGGEHLPQVQRLSLVQTKYREKKQMKKVKRWWRSARLLLLLPLPVCVLWVLTLIPVTSVSLSPLHLFAWLSLSFSCTSLHITHTVRAHTLQAHFFWHVHQGTVILRRERKSKVHRYRYRYRYDTSIRYGTSIRVQYSHHTRIIIKYLVSVLKCK